MMNFNFIAGDKFELEDFKDIERFVDSFPDFQTVVLKDESELKLLLQLIGINEFKSCTFIESEFSKYWDLSAFKLPEFDKEQFDQFYKNWLEKSHRDNNMDEYGNLIFLQGLSRQWNSMDFRLVVQDN